MRIAALVLLSAELAMGQDSVNFTLGPPMPPPLATINTHSSEIQFCAQSGSGKCLAVDGAGKVTRDDGLTRDELISLMVELTKQIIEGQKSINEHNDQTIEQYRKLIELQDRKIDLLQKTIDVYKKALGNVQKILSPKSK